MEKESELQRLEKFVEKVLVRFTALKAEKEQLEKTLSERDQTIEDLQNTISGKETERTEISSRVNKIVDQIEEWELNLEMEDEEGENLAETAQDEAQEIDELADEDEGDELADEDERRVQHELFSMSGSKE